MAEREGTRPPSSRDVAGEDFLFHLYRGSELLQDNRVHDAKAELEQALSLQPSDPKGQDLLGIVYFRLGLYPRAIKIYEQLIQAHPEAIEPRINLALSYLKTGQPASARAELEKVVEQQPGHSRAWGYLGLAFQRMGDYERASHAFAAGGHDTMARRLLEMGGQGGSMSLRPEPSAPSRAELRKAAGEAFDEIERSDAFRPASDHRGIPSGTWSAIEPGREQAPPQPQLVPSLAGGRASVPPSASAAPPSASAQHGAAARRPAELVRDSMLVFPRDMAVSLHASGMVMIQASTGFAARLEAVRSMAYAAGYKSATMQRRTRGRTQDEPLGGPSSPIVEIVGRGDLVLGPTFGHRLAPVALDEDALYIREDALQGFELSVTYENGRLPVGDGEAIAMVQLRGPGSAVLSLPERLASLEVGDNKSIAVRALNVVGWIGRIVPRALLSSETPAGMRGLVAFAGEGMVLVDGR
jgi:uncharacterized protein (AIM24 family)